MREAGGIQAFYLSHFGNQFHKLSLVQNNALICKPTQPISRSNTKLVFFSSSYLAGIMGKCEQCRMRTNFRHLWMSINYFKVDWWAWKFIRKDHPAVSVMTIKFFISGSGGFKNGIIRRADTPTGRHTHKKAHIQRRQGAPLQVKFAKVPWNICWLQTTLCSLESAGCGRMKFCKVGSGSAKSSMEIRL